MDLDREARLLAENAMRFSVASNLMRTSALPGEGSHSRREELMSLFSALTVSASGMAAQRTRAALLVENIANSETTRTPEGGPYRRKDAIFSTQDVGSAFGSELDFPTGRADAYRRHRDRDLGGPAARPRSATCPAIRTPTPTAMCPCRKVNPAEDMVDLMGANRSYQANVAAMSAVKDMIQKSIDLLR